MSPLPGAYSPVTLEAAQHFGARIRLARRQRRWTLKSLADRVGVTPVTMRKVERGDPSVRLGVAFEAAALLGVPLFDEDPIRRSMDLDRVRDGLALLPKAVRQPRQPDDDF